MGEPSKYQRTLVEIRTRVGSTAAKDVTELYKILTEEDGREPVEARKIIEHDLGDLYAKRTILDYLPVEAKDKVKVSAGKLGGEITGVSRGGQETVTIERAAGPAADDADLGGDDAKKPEFEGFIPEGIDDSKVDYWKSSDERHPEGETDLGKLQQTVNTMSTQMVTMKSKLDQAMKLIEKKEKKNIELDDANIKLRARLKAVQDGMPLDEKVIPDMKMEWHIGGGPIPDMEDDWYKANTTLGETLGHLRYLKTQRKERVSVRIIVIPQK